MPTEADPLSNRDHLSHAARAGVLARSHVEITGRDRATLLHGLCTNDIKRLRPGDGCEAFLTNVQGHVIGFVYVFCAPESLLLESAAGEAESIIRALDRYVVREDVRFTDRSQEWGEIIVEGPGGANIIARILGVDPPDSAMSHVKSAGLGDWVAVRRTSFVGSFGWQLVTAATSLPALGAALEQAGCSVFTAADIEVARMEAGTPIYRLDITDDHLPQEVDRNVTAISFNKGCYLGQETVARVDALGHVNRLLRGLRIAGDQLPEPGAEIRQDNKLVARITSSCYSPRAGGPLALAYVRRGHHDPGTRLSSHWGDVEVVSLPMPERHC